MLQHTMGQVNEMQDEVWFSTEKRDGETQWLDTQSIELKKRKRPQASASSCPSDLLLSTLMPPLRNDERSPEPS